MYKDAVNGTVSALIGLSAVIMASHLPDSNMSGDIGPRVFPYIGGGLLILCGILLGVTGRKKEKAKQCFLNANGFKRLGVIFSVLLIYALAMKYIGFLIPSIITLFILATLFAGEHKVALWKRIVFAVVVPGFIYFVFTKGLSLRMPMGTIEKAVNRLL